MTSASVEINANRPRARLKMDIAVAPRLKLMGRPYGGGGGSGTARGRHCDVEPCQRLLAGSWMAFTGGVVINLVDADLPICCIALVAVRNERVRTSSLTSGPLS